MAEESESQAAPKRRTRRTAGTRATRATRTTTSRRRATGGADLVDNLNAMVAELIKENRKLKRQLDRATAKGTKVASAGFEKGLKAIQRRVQRALVGAASPTRRRRTSATGTRRATTRRAASTTRRRRTSTGGTAPASS